MAGQLADRFSKRLVMVVVKIAEVLIALLVLVVAAQNLWITWALAPAGDLGACSGHRNTGRA